MSLTVSALFGPDMPNELKLAFFSFLPVPELCKTELVCKEWLTLSRNGLSWNLIHKPLSALANTQVSNDGSKDIKTIALAELHERQKIVDALIQLSETDTLLAPLIGSSSTSLKELKEMLPLKRTLLVARALKEDSTELLAQLAVRHLWNLAMHEKELSVMDYARDLLIGMPGGLVSMDQFCENDPCMLVLLELMEKPLGPFHANEMMEVAVDLLQPLPSLKKQCMHVIASIVRSHPDLTEFLGDSVQTPSDLKTPDGPEFMLGTEIIRDGVIPQMAEYVPDVTLEDWKKCGYVP